MRAQGWDETGVTLSGIRNKYFGFRIPQILAITISKFIMSMTQIHVRHHIHWVIIYHQLGWGILGIKSHKTDEGSS